MDKHVEKATSGMPAPSGDSAPGAGAPGPSLPPAPGLPLAPGLPPAAGLSPAPGLSPAGEAAVEPKSALASIASPSIAPTTVEMTAETVLPPSGHDAPATGAAGKGEETTPEARSDAAPASQEVIPFAARARPRASRRFSKFTLLAASVVLAAAFGATAGVLAATGLARFAIEAAPVEPPLALQTTIAELRSEVAALKAGVDTAGRTTGAQYSKLVERFDRVERAQSAANKSDAALPKESSKESPKETTGSITLPSAAAAPLPPAPVPQSAVVPGWAVRDVYRGVAMLQSRMGGMVEVELGDVLPSLGRIEAIRRQDGHWVVITSKGMITSMR